MKRFKIPALILVLAYTLSTTAYALDLFSIKTSLSSSPGHKSVVASVSSDEVLEFTASDLERRMELPVDSLKGVTVTSVPPASQGSLYLYGVEVEPYDYIARQDLDELCFVPNETAVSASLTLLPQAQDAVSTHLAISILESKNRPPVIENGSYSTVQNTRLSGFISASDPDGDAFTLQIIRKPEKGALVLDGQSFQYDPYKDMNGTDSFTVCAVDRFGNYSREATIDIRIEKSGSSFTFVDMNGNPSTYAAVKLHEKNILSGQRIGGSWFFYPAHQVSRGEFLVMLLAAGGMDSSLPATVNTGVPNDAQLPLWLKPYLKKAIEEGIWNSDTAFAHSEIPTRAEAVVLTDRAAKIDDVKDFQLQMSDASAIPQWAVPSYKDLAAYRMLDLYDGSAQPNEALTNSYAADLIWQLWKHYDR